MFFLFFFNAKKKGEIENLSVRVGSKNKTFSYLSGPENRGPVFCDARGAIEFCIPPKKSTANVDKKAKTLFTSRN